MKIGCNSSVTHQAEYFSFAASLRVRTGSGSDRIMRNLRSRAALPDPVATAPGSDTILVLRYAIGVLTGSQTEPVPGIVFLNWPQN